MWAVSLLSRGSFAIVCGWVWVTFFEMTIETPEGLASFVLMLAFGAFAMLAIPPVSRAVSLWRERRRMEQ